MRYKRNYVMKAIQSHSTIILYVLIGILLIYLVYPYVGNLGNLGNQREGLANKESKDKKKEIKPIDLLDKTMMKTLDKRVKDTKMGWGFSKYSDQYQTFLENNKQFYDIIAFFTLTGSINDKGVIQLKPKDMKSLNDIMTTRGVITTVMDTIQSAKSDGADGDADGDDDDDGDDSGGGSMFSIF